MSSNDPLPTSLETAPAREDDIDRELEREFLDEAHDTVMNLTLVLHAVRGGQTPAADALSRIRREVSTLRLRGRSVKIPGLSVIANRLEDYVFEIEALAPQHLQSLQTFLDQIGRVLDGSEADTADIVRALPVDPTFDPAEVTIRNVEILLVEPQRTTARIVARELRACGYRVTVANGPFEALELVTRIRPDMVVASATLGELSGIDLACALSAMPRTRHIPFALLTSFGREHASLDELPARAAILRKGPLFGDDLAEALSRLGIT
ncbi:MAG TPA: response regulator [Stellaceae bacterium]|nr:response regulator [Stellaceae bacterium]